MRSGSSAFQGFNGKELRVLVVQWQRQVNSVSSRSCRHSVNHVERSLVPYRRQPPQKTSSMMTRYRLLTVRNLTNVIRQPVSPIHMASPFIGSTKVLSRRMRTCRRRSRPDWGRSGLPDVTFFPTTRSFCRPLLFLHRSSCSKLSLVQSSERELNQYQCCSGS